MKTIRVCPGCGTPLPPDAPAGLCPQCLLKSAAPTLGIGATDARPAARPIPVPGQMFGAYRILRLLGQGGMGEVFEAEHGETGRRVALKVMSHALASEQDRKRFLREGRLAASVNHPNVVYIHGSEEIDGVPVITMELVHGGTLKERLKRDGPLPVTEAVEAALQMIAGLEAANHAGVLHRDIKPGNCFITSDGAVKVGDFGLSVSTLARGESLLTAAGSVLGTPAYASPEQLRGEELDVRSDIYSMGATLYHLLTGTTPLPATDFIKLITEVLDKQPAVPKALRADLPAELSKLLLRCLAKDRKARYQTYAELRDALLPFRAVEAVPASPAKRFLAGLVDDFIAYGPSLLFLVYWSFDPLDKLTRDRTLAAALVWAPFYLWNLLYYAVAEGLWGAGLGKSVCGLRVVGPERQPPGLPRALLRTVIYMVPLTLPSFLLMAAMPLAEMRAALAQENVLITDWLGLPLLVLIFVTMRRGNGYAALHDLFSHTRVIVKPRTQPRPKLPQFMPASVELDSASAPPVTTPASTRLGPYEIRSSLWQRGNEELLLAFDPALRRQVWIHRRPATAATVSAPRRDLSRPTRLRWLTSGRTETQLWDAYDAVEGQPLLRDGASARKWSAVRFWLLDLAEELGAALGHPDAAPVLALERVWLAADGRALLLDFPCPGLPTDAVAQPALPFAGVAVVQQFLDRVARVALAERSRAAAAALHEPAPSPLPGGEPATGASNEAPLLGGAGGGFMARPQFFLEQVVSQVPLPQPAQTFLASLAKGGFEKVEFIVGNLHSLIAKPAEVTRPWRAASLALVPTLMLGLGVLIGAMMSFERIRWDRAWNAAYPDKPSLRTVAQLYESAIEGASETNIFAHDVALTRAFLVHHFSDIITNDAAWKRPELRGEFSEPTRFLLKQAVTGHLPPKAADLEEAARVLPERIEQNERQNRLVPAWILLGSGIAVGLIFAFVEFVGAVVFRQSLLLRLFGLALVDRAGQPATRPRLLWRFLLTWGVVGTAGFFAAGNVAFVVAADMVPAGEMGDIIAHASLLAWTLGLSVTGLVLAATIYTVRHPNCSLQDRLAGTRMVPK